MQGGNGPFFRFYSWAMASISTLASLGRRAAWTAERAGVDFAAVLNGTTPAEDFAPWPCVYVARDLIDLARALGCGE